jgi:hypothetical protein
MPALSPDQPLSEVLTELQRIGSHLGQVQRGGTTLGILALEDVVEAFVGEVEDASHLDADRDPQPGHEHASTREAEGPDAGAGAGTRAGDTVEVAGPSSTAAVERLQEGSD